MTIGLFFGSFNPIHIGHLIIGNIMIESTDIKRLWYVVSPQNPFKKKGNLLHEFDRIDMINAAIYENYNMKACDIEFNMPRPSYTIDTLTYLTEQHPEHQFRLIIGSDNLKNFHKWKNYEMILDNYMLYVYQRPSVGELVYKGHRHIKIIEAPLLDISATYIRKSIREGRSIRYLVHDAVVDKINDKGYYR